MWFKQTRFCRLCGCEYIPERDIGRDGFCSTLHRVQLNRFINKLQAQGRFRYGPKKKPGGKPARELL